MKFTEKPPSYHESVTRFSNNEMKRKIIPQAWKGGIDTLLVHDLLSANRFFAEANPHIAEHIREMIRLDPADFFSELVRRWDWHNQYFEQLLEPALNNMLEDRHISLTPKQVEWLILAYTISSRIDQATLIATGAIKKELDAWTKPEYIGLLDEDEQRMLVTPPVDSFMVEYEREHLRYVLAVQGDDTSNAQQIKQNLINRYHIGDEEIFHGRMKRFEKYVHTGAKDLEKRIASLSLPMGYDVKHLYFTMERPRLKAIRDIVAFDNREEYYLLTSLIGVSGFVLRKRVLEYLDASKILPNNGNIYEFSDSIVVSGLEKLLEYRKRLMRKNVQGFAQSADTCASAAYMMAMHSLLGTPVSTQEEMRLHTAAQSKIIPGAFFSALASEGAKAGATVELLHSEPEMFRQGDFHSGVFQELLTEYSKHATEAESHGAIVRNGVEVSEQVVRRALENNLLPVVAGITGGFLHAVVAVGYSDDGIIIRDPLRPNPQVWKTGRLDRYMRTSIGNWMLLLGKNESLVNRYLRDAEQYRLDAERYLSTDGF